MAALSLSIVACGGAVRRGQRVFVEQSHAPIATRTSTTTKTTAARSDASLPSVETEYEQGDDDIDASPHHRDSDDYIARHYGRAASAGERRAIVAAVKGYFTAAIADDGAAGCLWVSARLAKSPNLGEIAETSHPLPPSIPPLQGQSCPAIMTLLFREDHARLAHETSSLQVVSVRVEGAEGLAILGFATMFERELPVRREGSAWKVDALLDKELV